MLTRFTGVQVSWWENLKAFTIILQSLHLRRKVHSPCRFQKKSMDPCMQCIVRPISDDDPAVREQHFVGIMQILEEYLRATDVRTIVSPTEVQGRDADGITSGNEGLVTQVHQHKREHSIQHTHDVLTHLFVLQSITVHAQNPQGTQREYYIALSVTPPKQKTDQCTRRKQRTQSKSSSAITTKPRTAACRCYKIP